MYLKVTAGSTLGTTVI